MDKTMIHQIYSILPGMLDFAKNPVWFDYDTGADTLYISFKNPQDATETIPIDDHILRRERNGELVGFTILHVRLLADAKKKG